MPTQTRSVMIRTEACRALLQAAKLLQNVKAMADAVPPGRKHPTVPSAIRRHLARALRVVEGSQAKVSEVAITDSEKESARWGSTDMTPQERVRSALSRAMLDTPRGRNEMASFVAQVVIAAAELKEAFEAEAVGPCLACGEKQSLVICLDCRAVHPELGPLSFEEIMKWSEKTGVLSMEHGGKAL